LAANINQSISLYRAIVQRRVLQCGYAESKRNQIMLLCSYVISAVHMHSSLSAL